MSWIRRLATVDTVRRGVLLDRPGVGAGAHLAGNLDDADDHDAEFGASAQHAGCVVYQGNRRLDGDVPRLRRRLDGDMPRLRVRLVHRVLGG